MNECPHYHGREGIGYCDANENRPCELETEGKCELWEEIQKEV